MKRLKVFRNAISEHPKRSEKECEERSLHRVPIGCTRRGSCNRTLLRRVLRRFSKSKCFLEGFLEGACKGFPVKTRFLEGFLEGSVL